MIITMQGYKAKKHGRTLTKINQWYPSTQICNKCGYQNKKTKNLNIRQWTCPQCHTTHDRDINAAKNILKEAQRIKKEEATTVANLSRGLTCACYTLRIPIHVNCGIN